MTRPTLEDLTAPPSASVGASSRQGIDAIADALLERFRHEEQAAPAVDSAALTAEAEDALYAWGVVCYEQGRYVDAAALFGALKRRCPPSLRLWKALGATHLARGEHAGASRAFAQASRLDPADAEIVFHLAQAEYLRSRPAEARRLLQTARSMAQAAAGKWANVPAWCDELLPRMEHPPFPNDRETNPRSHS